MTTLKKELPFILIFICVFILELVLFHNKTINPYVDFGREVYNPFAVLNGAVLYKDIFNIFGPFSYLFNALVYKILGVKLSSLLLAGYINLSVLLSFMYLCMRKFLKPNLSRVLIIFILIFCAFSLNLMNYVTPYSYAIVYGMTFFFISLFCFLEYLDDKKNIYSILSFLFCGFAISSKYEFGLYALVLFICFLRTKPNLKNIFLNCLCLILPLCAMILFLFCQGLTLNDLYIFFKDFLNYVKSPALKEFYNGTFYFSPFYFNSLVKSVLRTIPLILLSYVLFFFSRNTNKIIKNIFLLVYAFFIIFLIVKNDIFFFSFSFGYLPIAALICYIIKIKNIWNNPKYLLLTVSSFVLSVKVFWFLITYNGYGSFFLPIILISLLSVVYSFFFNTEKSKEIFNNFCVYFFSIITISAFIIYLPNLSQYKSTLNLPKGTIILLEQVYSDQKKISDFILKYTKPEDKIVILSESPFLNFMLGRKTDNYFHSLKAENVDAFGEDRIIKSFEKDKPKYFIVVTNPKLFMSNFGYDYAQNIAKWIQDNYNLIGYSETETKIYIYQYDE